MISTDSKRNICSGGGHTLSRSLLLLTQLRVGISPHLEAGVLHQQERREREGERERNSGQPPERNRQVHGAMVLASAGAHMLSALLDEIEPRGPADPEAGISAEAIEAARRGRTHVKLAMEISTTSAQEYWRSQTRRKKLHGRGHRRPVCRI